MGPPYPWGQDLHPPDSSAVPSSLPTPGFTDTFNMDTQKPRVIAGPKASFFGYTVQQHDISGKKW